MRIVLDTNVFVSAVFFGGIPGRILEARGHSLGCPDLLGVSCSSKPGQYVGTCVQPPTFRIRWPFPVAPQLAEHHVRNVGVEGSNLFRCTISFNLNPGPRWPR